MIKMEILIIYFFVINVSAFAAYGLDKFKARRGTWRIPEKTLLLLAVVGGSIGALGGMYLFRHKTRKRKFSLGVPLIFIIQVIGIVYFIKK